MILVKFNKYGDTLWNKYFDLSVNSSYNGIWIEETKDKGFILTGSGPGVSTDAYIVKTDSTGNVKWYRTFGGADLDQGRCVKQLSDNGYILLMRTFSYSPTSDILLIKTDSLGNEMWRKLFSDSIYNEIGNEIQVIGNSGFIIAGWKQITKKPASLYLIRLNLSGDTIWTKTYNNYSSTAAYSVDTTSDKGFIIGGIADSTTNNYPLSYLLKIDELGNLEWEKRYSSAFKEYCYSIKTLKNNRYAFCGMSDSTFFNYERAILRVIESNGNILIEKYFRSGLSENAFQSIDLTNDQGFILCGYSKYNLTKSFIVRTDSLGNINPIGINSNFELLKDFSIDQNYPNPFNSQTIIRFSLNRPAIIKIELYDVTGKYITTLLNEFKTNDSYNYFFDPQKYNLSSGIYFYSSTIISKINVYSKSKTIKMIYLK